MNLIRGSFEEQLITKEKIEEKGSFVNLIKDESNIDLETITFKDLEKIIIFIKESNFLSINFFYKVWTDKCKLIINSFIKVNHEILGNENLLEKNMLLNDKVKFVMKGKYSPEITLLINESINNQTININNLLKFLKMYE